MNELDFEMLKARNKRNNIIVLCLSLVLILVVFLYFTQNREHKTVVREMTVQKDSLQVELSRLSIGYDSLRTENDTINTRLEAAQTRVKALITELEQTKRVSFRKITEYQNQVNTMRGIMRDFVAQIDSLNRRNEILMAENLQVKEDYKRVETEKNQLSQEKDKLQQNLQRAAMLEARDLTVEALNDRNKDTKYAKRTEKLRVSLVLSKNVTAKRGSKYVYIRITRPDQLLLAKSQSDVFQFEDLKIQFSAAREVNYEGNELPVAIFWDNAGSPELVPGVYSVDVFADGNNIGTTSFSLK
jgi:preprotein translocase subunit SecD